MSEDNRKSDDALTEREYNERMSVENHQSHRESVERMLSLDCGQFIEKRGNLSYLSWASAWDRVLREDPTANYHVHQFADGPVQRMPTKGWMVWVDVTIHGLTRTMYLPVMDNRNQAIAEPDAFAINKTIQRALAKGIAMHGLGLYVYRGEDVPEGGKGQPEDSLDPETDPPDENRMRKERHDAAMEQPHVHEAVDTIKTALAAGDLTTAAAAWWDKLDDEDKMAIWLAPTKGGVFTTQERETIKTTEFRQAYHGNQEVA